MAHELVFRKNEAGEEVALMLYVKTGASGVPWHEFGQPYSTAPSLSEVKKVCGFDRKIWLEPCQTLDGEIIPNTQVVRDSDKRILGTVGPDYKVLQDHELFDSLLPWIEGGFAEVETAGMLKGGTRVWTQLKLKDSELEVCPGDPIKKYIMLAQGHDMSLGLVSGRTTVRIVCNNTLTFSLRDGGLIRRKHRGNVQQTAIDIQEQLLEWVKEDEKVIEAFRFLASKSIEKATDVHEFVKGVTGVEPKDARANSPAQRILETFQKGLIGNGSSWWHLLNAVTQDVTHNLGNKMKGDMLGDREGRALNKLWFAGGAKMNDVAFKVAMNLAQGKPADAKFALAA